MKLSVPSVGSPGMASNENQEQPYCPIGSVLFANIAHPRIFLGVSLPISIQIEARTPRFRSIELLRAVRLNPNPPLMGWAWRGL